MKILIIKIKSGIRICLCGIFVLVGVSMFPSYYLAALSNDETCSPNNERQTHHKNEIGVVLSPAYFLNENVWTFAMYVHYTRAIPNSKFGIDASSKGSL